MQPCDVCGTVCPYGSDLLEPYKSKNVNHLCYAHAFEISKYKDDIACSKPSRVVNYHIDVPTILQAKLEMMRVEFLEKKPPFLKRLVLFLQSIYNGLDK